jgi:hypothetical protein
VAGNRHYSESTVQNACETENICCIEGDETVTLMFLILIYSKATPVTCREGLQGCKMSRDTRFINGG